MQKTSRAIAGFFVSWGRAHFKLGARGELGIFPTPRTPRWIPRQRLQVHARPTTNSVAWGSRRGARELVLRAFRGHGSGRRGSFAGLCSYLVDADSLGGVSTLSHHEHNRLSTAGARALRRA